MCWGNIAYTALQLNLNLTIVAMVNQTALQNVTLSSEECVVVQTDAEPIHFVIDLNKTSEGRGFDEPTDPTNSSDALFPQPGTRITGELLWSPYTQGVLLGAIFYGYIASHLIGGLMAELMGGKWLMFGGIMIPSLLAFFIPVAARRSATTIFFVRVLQGCAAGVVTPVFYTMVGKWAPVHERSRSIGFLHLGSVLGSALTVVMSGVIASSSWGWPWVFYSSGFFGCAFCIIWASCGYSTPDDHPRISIEERHFIKNSIEESSALKKRDAKAPWMEVLTSGPFWSLFLVRFSYAWGSHTEQTAVPLFMQTVFDLPVEQNGFINGMMYCLSGFSAVLGGLTADQLRKWTNLRINTIRKSFSFMAYTGAAVCWISLTFSGCNVFLAILFVVLSKTFLTLSIAGDYVAIVDMAPQYAGTLSGILFTVADTTGFLSPLVTGAIINDNVTLSRWSYVFYCVSAIVIVGLVGFVCFGSAELQPWAMEDPKLLSTTDEKNTVPTSSMSTSTSVLTLSGRRTYYGSASLGS